MDSREMEAELDHRFGLVMGETTRQIDHARKQPPTNARLSRGGKLDHVSFNIPTKTEQAVDLACVSAFQSLGAVYDSIKGKTLDASSRCIESTKPERKERGPVQLTEELVACVHEPPHESKLVEVDYNQLNILRPASEQPIPLPYREVGWGVVWDRRESPKISASKFTVVGVDPSGPGSAVHGLLLYPQKRWCKFAKNISLC